jgi:hypothetical protein
MRVITRVTTRIVWDMETGEVLAHNWHNYVGTMDRLCGASSEENAAFQNEQTLAGEMGKDFNAYFGENQAILGNLTTTLNPVIQAGPNQYGFSNAEDAALRSSAMNTNAAAGAEASNAVRSSMAAAGGGNVSLPSGSAEAENAALAENQAQTEAAAQTGITEAGYQAGRQEFNTAVQQITSAPGALENPVTGAGEGATGAAGQEMQGAADITQANQAWMAPVAGLVGSLGGAALGIPKMGGGGGGSTPLASPSSLGPYAAAA